MNVKKRFKAGASSVDKAFALFCLIGTVFEYGLRLYYFHTQINFAIICDSEVFENVVSYTTYWKRKAVAECNFY